MYDNEGVTMPRGFVHIIAFVFLGIVGMILLFMSVSRAEIIIVDKDGGGDHITIQDGVDASQDGDFIVIHEGTYAESVNVTKSISLMAAGEESVIIKKEGSNISISIQADNVHISDLTFQDSYIGISMQMCEGTVIENCTFKNCRYAIFISSSSKNSMINNTFSFNQWAGIHLSDRQLNGVYGGLCEENHVFKNHFNDNNRGIVIYSQGVGNVFAENLFENNTNAGIFIPDDYNVVVDARFNWWNSDFGPYNYDANPFGRGDTVSNNIEFDPWIGKTDIPQPMALIEAFVLETAPAGGNGSEERPFKSIMEAVYHTRTSGTIHVWEGVYFDHLIIRKSLKIIGNGSDETIIESGVFGDCVTIRADSVEIRKMGIRVSSNTSLFLNLIGRYPGRNSCLRIESSGNIIADCVLSEGIHGFILTHSSYVAAMGFST